MWPGLAAGAVRVIDVPSMLSGMAGREEMERLSVSLQCSVRVRSMRGGRERWQLTHASKGLRRNLEEGAAHCPAKVACHLGTVQ